MVHTAPTILATPNSNVLTTSNGKLRLLQFHYFLLVCALCSLFARSSLILQTVSIGNVVDDNQNSMTAGEFGPVLLQDFHLIDKISHFDRERIPERVVHAKGAGAHGYFGK